MESYRIFPWLDFEELDLQYDLVSSALVLVIRPSNLRLMVDFKAWVTNMVASDEAVSWCLNKSLKWFWHLGGDKCSGVFSYQDKVGLFAKFVGIASDIALVLAVTSVKTNVEILAFDFCYIYKLAFCVHSMELQLSTRSFFRILLFYKYDRNISGFTVMLARNCM